MLGIAIMLIGVAFFSYIISTFISIVQKIQNIEERDENYTNLNNWLTILRYFNKGKVIPKELTQEIEHYFDFYWENERLGDIQQDNEFVQALPSAVKYMYDDIFFEFRSFFNTYKN